MKSEDLQKHVINQQKMYAPEAIIKKLINNSTEVENDLSYIEKFIVKHDLRLSKEELEKKIEAAKEALTLLDDKKMAVKIISSMIDKEVEADVDIFSKEFDVSKYISGLKDSSIDENLSGPLKVFKYEQIVPESEKEGTEIKYRTFKMEDDTYTVLKIRTELRKDYDTKENVRVYKKIDLIKLDSNKELLEDSNNPFFTTINYEKYNNIKQVGVRAFNKDSEAELVSRLDLKKSENVFLSKQYNFITDELNETTITPNNTKVIHNMKDYDNRYLNGKLYSTTQKRHANSYSQATELNNEKELTVSFQLKPKNGIFVPMNFKKKEDDSFLISYISTTPDTIYWEYNITKSAIKITVKEEKHGKPLKHEYNLSATPDEMEMEFHSIGNQLFYQDFKTIEEVIKNIPKIMKFYNKLEEECKGDLNNISQHITEAEEIFTDLKYMSYSKRIKKENQSKNTI